MPGWILVANRFSLLPIIRKRGLLSAMASLICLVAVSGCSNIRQQSLDLPLPILPSENATATLSNGEVQGLPLPSDSGAAEYTDMVESSAEKSASTSDQATLQNDFPASEYEQSPSVQSFLPPAGDFEPQQPHARFVGELDKAEMSDIKLAASTDKASPAPKIAQATHESKIENCENPELCDATAQCDCCKKKVAPKFAVVEPIDPEQLPKLFGPGHVTPESKTIAPLQSALRPLPTTNVASEPIRLIAHQDSETNKAPEPSEPAQTQNKAQMLIPIAPAALQVFRAEVDQELLQEAQAAVASQTIKVSPIMDINSAPIEKSPLPFQRK